MTVGTARGRVATPARELATLTYVDAALRRSRGRDLYTRDEARKLLCGARETAESPAAAAAVASVVEDALASFPDDRFVDRTRVVDPLLEIRLAVTR